MLTPETLRKLASLNLSPEQMSGVLSILADGIEREEERKLKDAKRTRVYRQRGGGNIPELLRQEVMARDNQQCKECDSFDYPQIDHIYPISKGGQTLLENLQILCRPCNARKKDRIRKEFRGIPMESPLNGSDSFNGFPDPSFLPLTSLDPPKESIPKGIPKKNPHKPHSEPFIRPEGIPADAWQGFVEMRIKIKKPMTDLAKRMAVGKVEKFVAMGHDPSEILNQSTFNGWQDLYEIKENNYATNGKVYTKGLSKSDRARLAILESAEELGYA